MLTVEEIFQKLQQHRRCCSVATVGGFRPPEDPLTSWFGGNFLSLPEASWPATSNGPMVPLLQAVAADTPLWPSGLGEFSVVQLFVDRSTLPLETPAENGEDWLFRGYRDTSTLVRVPDPAPQLRPFPIRWRIEQGDSPSWDDLDGLLDHEEHSLLATQMERYFDTFTSVYGTKLGGWPSYIQGAPFVGHRFVLQVASEGKSGWAWGDSGNGYVYRDRSGSHVLHWDCY